MLKNLAGHFDIVRFAAGKKFCFMCAKEWLNYKTKEHEGVRIIAVISEDDEEYKKADGTLIGVGINRFEKLTFKIKSKTADDYDDIPQNTEIVPINPRCTIYGDHMENLSIICDDIEVVSVPTKD